MRKQYKQRYYKPINEDKYLTSRYNLGKGDVKYPFCRSSYEIKFCKYCDNSPNIIKWSSEPFPIKYISPIDGKEHRYYIDFYIEVKDKNHNIKKYLVEIKPSKETKPPSKRMKEHNYKKALKTYLINQAKWKAAKLFAYENGMQFIIITEKELDI